MNKYKVLLGLLKSISDMVVDDLSLKKLEGGEITITGATGLVGLNIVSAISRYNKKYAKNKIHINAISHSHPSGVISELFNDKNIISIFGDITDHGFINRIPNSDYIIHSAGYGQPIKFMDDKMKTISINTTTTIELIKKLNNNGRFLFLSSSEVYSGSSAMNNVEKNIGTTDPSHHRACYIEGKRTGEAIVNAARTDGINAVSARLALAYGPGIKNHDTRVLNQLIMKGLDGEIGLLDAGESIRTYCYISDVVSMLLNILMKSKSGVYNVGGKSVLSIKDLALKIGKYMGVPVYIPDTNSFLSGAPYTVGLDLTKIEDEYGSREYVDFDYGLAKTIEWIRALS